MQPSLRPTGVTALAILASAAGIFSLLLGVLLLAAGALLASTLLVSNGFVDFALAIGYMHVSGWAWTLAIVFGAVNIVGSTLEIVVGLSNNILGIILSTITIVYLTRPNIRAFFGRGPHVSGVSAQTILPMATRPASSSSITRLCRKCGDAIPAGAGFCRACDTVQ